MPEAPASLPLQQSLPSQSNLQGESVWPGYSGRFWAVALLTGVGAGLGGAGLMELLHAVQHWAWSYHAGTFLEAVRRAPAARRVLILLAAGTLVGIGRWALKRATGGHGAELSQAIWFHSGRLPLVRTLASAILSITAVGMGASIGREGALKQTGAAVASRLCEWVGLTPSQRRLLVACGAGAGMAAAYNVPFGGALFALEVLLGTLELQLVVPALACSLVATGVSWIWLPHEPIYSVPAYGLWARQIAWAAAFGPVAGVAAAGYVKAIAWADARTPKKYRLLPEPIVVLAALGASAIALPQLLGNGKDVVQLAFVGQVGIGLLSVLWLLKPVATVGCLGSGVPGGLFTPTMTFGAVLGGLAGHGWDLLWPGAPPGSYAMIGSAAMLAASTQGPVSSIVLVMELTRRADAMMVPLMLAVAGASLVTRRLELRSIYSARVRQGRLEAALAQAERPAAGVGGLPLEPCAVISAAGRYPQVLRELLALPGRRGPLYVLDERGRLVGQIRAGTLASAPPSPLETVTAADLAAPVEPLPASASKAEALGRLASAEGMPVPVVSPEDGRLLGVVQRQGDPR